MKRKQPADVWDGRALQQEEGMTRLWSPAELSSPGGRTGKVERKGWGTEVGEGAASFG